ncbi:alpha-L-fucosidase [Solitalea canadensis]|uniref:alpha-L-fucosidase n=1 Tax=Solitalea canadensis (strain ATCC 29591 / DSM 3403 / JCM 21819 / LMG 8368 / NBRC 15130 / NCIMB 12057 / USAM 9D) TaxID=929556 RepID=H8KVU0_SOLCM|nr:alpha-L-fucosidase [Solitalea canadensis]AFD06713.1 alpha-L-fucosidase [Solitalea canadensis DSM 3403]
MKIKVVLLGLLLNAVNVFAQADYKPSTSNLEARKLFQEARFGMFIHWGVSSVLGHGEWVMNERNIHVSDYKHLQDFFNPQKFDAQKWVATAKGAGMKYITFITRHHDSFSNWDTKQSDWKITNTPYGKDVLKQLADECHKQGIKLVLYYSLLDWYRTDYQYWTGRTGQGTGRTEKGDWNNYIKFMKNQLTELLTNYGEISGIWFDGHWDQTAPEGEKDRSSRLDWHYDEIYTLIHTLQPQCLIGNNHHLSPFSGEDFQMFERDLPGQNKSGLSFQEASDKLPLETCETLNGSWGYNITDTKYKSAHEIIRLLVNAASLNANLLLNIGPMPNGEIQPEFSTRLDSVGKWMQKYGNSVYGTKGSEIKSQTWGVITEKDKEIYLHVFDSNKTEIIIDNFPYKPSKLSLFNVDAALNYSFSKGQLKIDLTKVARDDFDTVLKLKVKRK